MHALKLELFHRHGPKMEAKTALEKKAKYSCFVHIILARYKTGDRTHCLWSANLMPGYTVVNMAL